MALYEHQKRIIEEDPKKTGLFLGTGSGKTATALVLAEGATIVLCPKTQRDDKNWQREAQRLRSERQPLKVRSLFVYSKEEFRRDAAIMPVCDTLIVDEAHKFLGVTQNTRYRKRVEYPKTSLLFDALCAYIERVQPKRLYLCSATIVKAPFTVWGAAVVLRHTPYTLDSFKQFRSDFYQKLPMPGKDVHVSKKDEHTKKELAKLVHRIGYVGRLWDYFDVPPQTYKLHHVELTQEQKDLLKKVVLEYPDPIVRIGRRHQIENGILSGDEFTAPTLINTKKTDAILDYAAEFPRMVVFAKYRAQIAEIDRALLKEGYRTWVLNGDTKNRGELLKEANEASEGVFIAQCQVAEGWELPEFPVMIFASRTYSLTDYLQAQGRILRANALKKNLFVNLVAKGGVDEAVDEALASKVDFDEKLYAQKGS